MGTPSGSGIHPKWERRPHPHDINAPNVIRKNTAAADICTSHTKRNRQSICLCLPKSLRLSLPARNLSCSPVFLSGLLIRFILLSGNFYGVLFQKRAISFFFSPHKRQLSSTVQPLGAVLLSRSPAGFPVRQQKRRRDYDSLHRYKRTASFFPLRKNMEGGIMKNRRSYICCVGEGCSPA